VAFALRYIPAWRNETALFVVAGLGIIPLAGWLGRATDQLAQRTGAGLGGLLNATFGNAAELIIALMALSKGLTTVVKASLTGSIIGNLLLVLGTSIFAGALRFHKQTFNRTGVRASTTAMSLAAVALIIPTVFHVAADARPGGWTPAAEQRLSLAIAGVLFLHLRRHAGLLARHAQVALRRGGERQSQPTATDAARASSARHRDRARRLPERVPRRVHPDGATPTRPHGNLSRRHRRSHRWQCGRAYHRRLVRDEEQDGLTLSIAIGSSLQVALFVTPVASSPRTSWAIGWTSSSRFRRSSRS
jgi:Ca2+/H+ antiporter